MGQRHVCTFRHAQRAAYRTAISAAQTCDFVLSNAVTMHTVDSTAMMSKMINSGST